MSVAFLADQLFQIQQRLVPFLGAGASLGPTPAPGPSASPVMAEVRADVLSKLGLTTGVAQRFVLLAPMFGSDDTAGVRVVSFVSDREASSKLWPHDFSDVAATASTAAVRNAKKEMWQRKLGARIDSEGKVVADRGGGQAERASGSR